MIHRHIKQIYEAVSQTKAEHVCHATLTRAAPRLRCQQRACQTSALGEDSRGAENRGQTGQHRLGSRTAYEGMSVRSRALLPAARCPCRGRGGDCRGSPRVWGF